MGLQNDAKPDPPAKRPRLSSTARSSFHASQPVVHGYRIGTYAETARVFTLEGQKHIYQAWRNAGCPHNSICYTCRRPAGDMLECMTCCRSYHIACCNPISPSDSGFQCPTCRGRGWDEEPPPYMSESTTQIDPQTHDEVYLRSASNRRVEEEMAGPMAPDTAAEQETDLRDKEGEDEAVNLSSQPHAVSQLAASADSTIPQSTEVLELRNQVQELRATVHHLETTVAAQESELAHARDELRTKDDLLRNLADVADNFEAFTGNVTRLQEMLRPPNG
ncbi:hypothetical protein NA57DRAFT_61807 [Rhizodiscina lignyota]|uniref:PHD-type domain-containing protein n=1 Tax=Rhizodiscina lignyota TaxID=1504668 RepID=A0A9P4M063_9PEZI|nr:hypothetical protein NA57DRAFT_61807 [Rhizodiscina lignyota]